MNKHIIIAGAPRSGKSTICKQISHTFGYQHISMDSIVAGIEKVFPETGINSDADVDALVNVRKISRKLAPFIQAMIESGEYDECDYGMLIDVYQLLPEDFVRYIDPVKCSIFYFITSDLSIEERIEILKEYDTPADYTFYDSEETKHRRCAEIVRVSAKMKDQCEKYGLLYFETAYDRDQVILDFIQNQFGG